MANLLSQAQSLIPAAGVRRLLREQKPYNENRERAAVVLGPLVTTLDFYTRIRPYLFIGSSIGAAVSAYLLWKRRGRGIEPYALWGTTFVACSAVAWLSRPVSVPPGAGPAAGEPTSPLLAWLDAKRAAYRAQDPQWAEKVYERIYNTPGIKETLDKNPVLKALVL